MRNVDSSAITLWLLLYATMSFSTQNYSFSFQTPSARWKQIDCILCILLCREFSICMTKCNSGKVRIKKYTTLNFKNIRNLFFILSCTGRRILVTVLYILFKWTIYIRNNLSIISATVSSMKNPGCLFGWVWSCSDKPFLTTQLKFYCFCTSVKWVSYQSLPILVTGMGFYILFFLQGSLEILKL